MDGILKDCINDAIDIWKNAMYPDSNHLILNPDFVESVLEVSECSNGIAYMACMHSGKNYIIDEEQAEKLIRLLVRKQEALQ